MTVAELIKELQDLPQDLEVVASFSPGGGDAYLDAVSEVQHSTRDAWLYKRNFQHPWLTQDIKVDSFVELL